MRVARIELRKFRSIEKCIVYPQDIWCLVGENNSGKSAILRALNSFFNLDEEKEEFLEGSHQYTQASWPQVWLDFSDVPVDSKLSTYSTEGECRVRLRFKPKYEDFTYEVHNDGWGKTSFNIPYEINKFIDYVFIPPIRGPKQIRWEEKTLLKSAVEAHLDHYTSSRDTATPKFTQAANYLEDNALSSIANSLADLYDLKHNFDFEIRYDSEIDYSDFLNKIKFIVKDKGLPVELSDCGTGIQSMVIIALHRYIASLNDKDVIIGLEEPESNLHPQSQRELISSLTGVDEVVDSSQVIMTTHSPVLIDELKHDQVVLVRKVSDDKRGFKSLITQIDDNFWAKVDLDQAKYYDFHKYKNSEFFFSKGIILVEGKSDEGVLRILMESEGVDLESNGVSVMSLDGVNNIKYPYHLLDQLKIPCFYILDKDYFLPYRDGSKKKSRDDRGFPQYKYSYNEGRIIQEIIPSLGDRDKLLEMFGANHTKALDILEKHNVVCMRRNLEADLFVSEKARKIFAKVVGLDGVPSVQNLLVDRSQQIKHEPYLVATVDRLPNKNLPRSYSRIKSSIIDFIDSVNG